MKEGQKCSSGIQNTQHFVGFFFFDMKTLRHVLFALLYWEPSGRKLTCALVDIVTVKIRELH